MRSRTVVSVAKKKAPSEVTALVRALYELSGQPSQRQWALSAGLLEEQVSDYLKGYGINGANLVKLMRVSGVLDSILSSAPAALAGAARPVDRESPAGLPVELEEVLGRILAATSQGFREVRERLEAVEQRLPPQALPDDQPKRAAN